MLLGWDSNPACHLKLRGINFSMPEAYNTCSTGMNMASTSHGFDELLEDSLVRRKSNGSTVSDSGSRITWVFLLLQIHH